MYRKVFVLIVLFISLLNAESQSKLDFNGYISNMGQASFSKNGDYGDVSYFDLIIHNRLNLNYYANDKLTFYVGVRNQFLWGETMQTNLNYADIFQQDRGVVDMNFNWYSNNNSLLNTQFDRAYAEYVSGKWAFSAGRQRVNWGRSLVWNPNDIFNAFSYYDFDYPERPGSDALRAQYYLDMASSVELVAKTDSANNLTIAGLYKFNKWSYDIQFMGGYVNSEDYVLGAGWEGNIKSLGFRGEATYYHSQENFTDSVGSFLASVSFDYLLSSSVSLQAEFLYNDPKTTQDITNPSTIFNAPPTSKSLSFSEYNIFTNVSWTVNPILTLSTAGMYYTDFNGYFLMPGADFSITEDLYISLIYQYFNLQVYDTRATTNLFFGRLKWNF